MGRTIGFALLMAVTAATLGVAGCGGNDESQSGGGTTGAGGSAVTVTLDEQNGSGESGTATLTPESSTSTKVVVELSNPPSDPQPAHIHPGTCATLDPTPKYALPNIVDGKVEATVPVGLEQLQSGEFAINVHKSEAEANVYFACGDIPKRMPSVGY